MARTFARGASFLARRWKIIQEKEYLIRCQNDNGVESGDEEWIEQDQGDLLGQVSSTDDSSRDEGAESCEEKSEEIKQQCQVMSNEDKGVSEKEKYSAKLESRSPLERIKLCKAYRTSSNVYAKKINTSGFNLKQRGLHIFSTKVQFWKVIQVVQHTDGESVL